MKGLMDTVLKPLAVIVYFSSLAFSQSLAPVAENVDNKLKELPSVKDFGAIGNGTTDDSAKFVTACTAKSVVRVPIGTYLIGANTAISCSLQFEGGVLSIASGKILTISLPVIAGPMQIFSGSGSIAYSSGAQGGIMPEWFGAKADDLNASAAANTTAINAASALGPIVLQSGIYKVTATTGNYALTIQYGIKGVSPNDSIIKNIGTGSAMKIYHAGGFYFGRFESFRVYGNSSSQDGIVLGIGGKISSDEVAYASFLNVDSWYNGRHGIVQRYGWGTKWDKCKASYNSGLGMYLYSIAGDLESHNNVVIRDCEISHNGGTGNSVSFTTGGIRIEHANGVYIEGGTIEENNAWGVIANGADFIIRQLEIKGVYFESNPVATAASKLGGNFYLKNNYQNVSLHHCWGTYGGAAGVTGYAMYVANSAYSNSYFKEYQNYFSDVGAGTNIRDHGIGYDWTVPYVSKTIPAGNTAIITAAGTGPWFLTGTIHVKCATGEAYGGLYPFVVGFDSGTGGYTATVGAAIVGGASTTAPTLAWNTGTGALSITLAASHTGHIQFELGGTATYPLTTLAFSAAYFGSDFTKRSN